MFRDAALRSAPGPGGSLLDVLAMVTQSDIDDFRAGIDPLARAGKLAALLAQFPPSFKSTPAAVDYLQRLLRLFGDYPLAVELRHSSWSDAFGATLQLLNSFGAAWVQIDEPKFHSSIRQNAPPNVTGFYYMRLHGRNAAQWWRHDKSEDRYNYLYSAGGAQRRSRRQPRAAKALVKKACLYTNNHFAAKSVVNAVMLKAQLGEPIEGEYPPRTDRSATRRSATSWRGRVRLPSGFHGHSSDGSSGGFTVTLLMTSKTSSSRTTSIPEVT